MKTIVSLRTGSLLHTPSSKSNMLLSPVGSLSPGGVLPCSKCVMLLLTHFRRSITGHTQVVGVDSSRCYRRLGEEYSMYWPPK